MSQYTSANSNAERRSEQQAHCKAEQQAHCEAEQQAHCEAEQSPFNIFKAFDSSPKS
jgi:hypothetical protein